MYKTFNNNKYDKLLYWLFNNDTDKPISKSYIDIGTDINHNISLKI